MLQLMVHCSTHRAFKGLVTIKQPSGICHTCKCSLDLRQFDFVRRNSTSMVEPAFVVSYSSPRFRSIFTKYLYG
jgi:hypothetical protein